MQNKYYVPSIEEFRVGFEYEEKSSGLWTKQIYNESSPILNAQILDEYGCKLDTIKDYIEQEQVRVKYLDTSDIESFGFSHIGALWFENIEKSYRIRKWKGNEVDIYKWLGDEDSTLIFRGKIKNKSELKVLLKQLSII